MWVWISNFSVKHLHYIHAFNSSYNTTKILQQLDRYCRDFFNDIKKSIWTDCQTAPINNSQSILVCWLIIIWTDMRSLLWSWSRPRSRPIKTRSWLSSPSLMITEKKKYIEYLNWKTLPVCNALDCVILWQCQMSINCLCLLLLSLWLKEEEQTN